MDGCFGGSQLAQEIIAVIGGGTMGSGIAQVFATAGFHVILHDVSIENCEHGLNGILARLVRMHQKGRLYEKPETIMNRIEIISTLEEMKSAELVIEAAIERMDIKRGIFQTLDSICPPSTVLATNTSSLSVTEIAAATKHPDRVLGMHFFNPAPRMALVEIIAGFATTPEIVDKAIGFVNRANKTPIRAMDTPGFIVNRVARPFYNEALRIAGERVATIHQIDRILKSAGFRMGPFELQDLIGIDINFATTESTYQAFFQDARFRPSPIQHKMVRAGMLGRKVGRGYYQYDKD